MPLLEASERDRTLRYLLLPWGERGRTSIGEVVASPGSVELPDDPASVKLNLEHDRRRPVGRALQLWEEAAGVLAVFTVARTSVGDDVLEEAAAGLRTGVSVEVDEPVVRRGRLLSGLLTAAAAVVEPAFPSARLAASDCGDLDVVAATSAPNARWLDDWLGRHTHEGARPLSRGFVDQYGRYVPGL